MMEYILCEQKDQLVVLTFSRPKALNALNDAMMAELSELLDEIAASDTRCLVVTGAGEKAFVAGADIAEMKELVPQGAVVYSEKGSAIFRKLEQLPIPVIAAVNGYALGGGCELALACDIRIAADDAVFGLPEVTLGIMPGYGGVQRLVRLIGSARAKELAFTGNRIGAQQALTLGLVNMVVPKTELLPSALKMAEKIAGNAPIAVRAVKAVANGVIGVTIDDSFGLEKEVFGNCFGTEDQKEAMSAFLDKRKPKPFCGK